MFKNLISRFVCWFRSKQARYFEKKLNNELMFKGVLTPDDISNLLPEKWEVINPVSKISSFAEGYSRRNYPLKVVLKEEK